MHYRLTTHDQQLTTTFCNLFGKFFGIKPFTVADLSFSEIFLPKRALSSYNQNEEYINQIQKDSANSKILTIPPTRMSEATAGFRQCTLQQNRKKPEAKRKSEKML